MRFLVHGVPRRSTLLGTVVRASLRKKRAKRNARPGTRRWVPAVQRAAPIEPSAEVVNAGGPLWLGSELLQHRAPLVLLIVNERSHFGGGHRTRIAAAAGKLCRERGVADHFAQVLAGLAHDRFGSRCAEATASGLRLPPWIAPARPW